MRLSQEKARQLSRLVWRERLRTALPFVLAVVLLGAGATYFFLQQIERTDRTVDVKVHDGKVVNVKKQGASRAAAIVVVHLDDGRDVDAFSGLRVVPAPGAHVTISEARHASGKLTYDITGWTD